MTIMAAALVQCMSRSKRGCIRGRAVGTNADSMVAMSMPHWPALTSRVDAKPMYSRRTTLTLLFLAALGCCSGTFADDSADTVTPEERMNRRFPQRVLVGDLLGDPLLDDDNRTLGRVEKVVRTHDGKVVLVTTFGSDRKSTRLNSSHLVIS